MYAVYHNESKITCTQYVKPDMTEILSKVKSNYTKFTEYYTLYYVQGK